MKTNKLILSAGIFALALASCTDLDVPVNSQYTGLVSTPQGIEANMNDLYTRFHGALGRRYMEAMTLTSDEFTSIAQKGNWIDSYAYAHPSFHNQTSEDATVDWMCVLGQANVKACEIIDSDYPEDLKYRARAMRAFFTFLIMENWGDAPLPDAAYCTENNIDANNRAPRKEVAKWLEKELKEIADKLPEQTTGDNYGKPNKYMAYALLAKLYINWGVYTCDAVEDYDAASTKNEKLDDCIAACDVIINTKGKFDLGPDEYRFKFNHDNTERVQAGTIKDFIYAASFDTNGANGGLQGMQWGRSHSYKDIKTLNPSMFGEAVGNSGGGYIVVTPECVNRFNLPGDQRNWMVLGVSDKDGNPANGVAYVYDKNELLPTSQIIMEGTHLKDENDKELPYRQLIFSQTIEIPAGYDVTANSVLDDVRGWNQGYRSMKWFICHADYSNGRNQSNDVPIFRYADVLLMKAEALVRSNQSGAKELFNQIRRYVKAPELTTDPTLNDIYDERGREFFDELWRRNDMIRFGHYEDEFFPHYKSNEPTASFDKRHRIFPISKNDLDVNDGWTQNPGYNK